MIKKICNVLLIFLFVGCFLYLYSKGTYTIYESQVSGDVSSDVSKWNIKVNDTLVTDTDMDIDISNVNFTGRHMVPNKVGPGSSGEIKITIDPLDTEVAIRYELEITDKSVDPNKILTLQSISSAFELIRTGVNSYTGIISLDDIKNKKVNDILLSVSWLDTLDIDVDTIGEDSDDFITVHFHAVQYMGEEVVAYTE